MMQQAECFLMIHHEIMTRRFLNKEVSNTEFADYVGKLSREERAEMSRLFAQYWKKQNVEVSTEYY